MKRLVPYLGFLLIVFIASAVEVIAQKSSGHIPAGGFKVYYEQSGEGDVVLLLHAGLQDHSMWDEQVKALSKKYRVVTIDLPFHGNTTGFDTTTLAAEVVKTVLDKLKIEKVSVAGLSMGAAITQDFIIAYPQRVNKAILISSAINGYERKFGIDSASMQWFPNFFKALEAKDTALAALVFTKTWSEGIDQQGDSLTKEASHYVYKTTLTTLKQHKMMSWPRLSEQPLAFDAIAQVKMPVLIIHGDKDLPYVATCSEYLEKTLPQAKRVLLRGVAHMLNIERPDEVNRLIIEFLGSKQNAIKPQPERLSSGFAQK
jgi:pimeloyl-ACP methyl ester carboxylesterase